MASAAEGGWRRRRCGFAAGMAAVAEDEWNGGRAEGCEIEALRQRWRWKWSFGGKWRLYVRRGIRFRSEEKELLVKSIIDRSKCAFFTYKF